MTAVESLQVIVCVLLVSSTFATEFAGWEPANGINHRNSEIRLMKSPKSKLPCPREGYFRNPKDCSRFYRCVDEFGAARKLSIYEGYCESGLVFDENVNACNWPELAEPCTNSPTEKLQSPGNSGQTNKTCKNRSTTTTTETPAAEDVNQVDRGGGQSGQETFQQVQESDPSGKDQELRVPTEEKKEFFQQVTIADLSQPIGNEEKEVTEDQRNQQIFQQILISDDFSSESEEPKVTTENQGSQDTSHQWIIPEDLPVVQEDDDNHHVHEDDVQQVVVEEEIPIPPIRDEGTGSEGSQEIFQQVVIDDSPAKEEERLAVTDATRTTGSGSVFLTTLSPLDNTQGDESEQLVCTREGFFRHPTNCTRFYRCVSYDGVLVAHVFTCPKKLVFNETQSLCDRAEGEECNESIDRAAKPKPQKGYVRAKRALYTGARRVNTRKLRCTKEGFFRHPDGCNVFYRCVASGPQSRSFSTYVFTCPNNLVFDEELQTCNWPEKAAPCTDISRSPVTRQTISSPTRKSSWKQKGSERNGGVRGQTKKQPPKVIADDPKRGGGHSTRTTAKPSEKESGSGLCSENGFFTHPDDCKKFYKCVDFDGKGGRFVRYDFTCPQNLAFDEGTSTCNWPHLVSACGNKGSSKPSDSVKISALRDEEARTTDAVTEEPNPGDETTTLQPEKATEEEKAGEKEKSQTSETDIVCSEEGYFRHPKDCNKFYRCVDFRGDGQQYVRYDFTCPEGLVFDEINSICNWPTLSPPCDAGGDSSEKDQRSTTESTSVTEATEDGSNEEETEAGESGSPATDSSTQSTGESSETTATDNEDLSSTHEQGTTESEAGERTTESEAGEGTTESEAGEGTTESEAGERTTDSGSGTTKSTDIQCTEEGFFRNPNDCNKFYRCVDFRGDGQQFVRYDFHCPEGLVFDEVNSVCNWPTQSPGCESGKDKDSSGREETTTSGSDNTEETDGETESEATSSTVDTGNTESSSNTHEATESQTESSATTERETTTKGFTEDGQTTSAEGSTTESEKYICTEEGFFRYPEKCNEFYRCIDNTGEGQQFDRYEFICPVGLVFDEEMIMCVPPEESTPCEKEDKDSLEKETTSTLPSTSDTEEVTDDLISSTESSTTTDSSTSESPTVSEESTAEQGTTTERSTDGDETTSDESSTTQAKEIQCTKEGFFRNPNDCSKFYRCVDFRGDGQQFVRYDFDCPDGLVFDEVNSVCNWPTQSPACKSGEESSEREKTTTSSDGPSTTTSSSTVGEETSEPTSTTTESDIQSTTEQRSTTDSTTDHSTDRPTDSTTDQSTDRPTDSTTDQSTDRSTDSTTDQSTHLPTDSEKNPSTTDRSTSEATDSTTSGSDSECTEAGFFRNPEDCSKFYRCVDFRGDGRQYVRYDFDCPQGLVFDEANSVCNWPEDSSPCDSSSTESSSTTDSTSTRTTRDTTTSASTTASEGEEESSATDDQSSSTERTTTASSSTTDASDCTEEGFFRDPSDCKKYYRCIKDDEADGRFVKDEYSCSEGEVFDEEGKFCNREELSPPPCGSATNESTTSATSTDFSSTSTTAVTEETTSSTSSERTDTESTDSSTDGTTTEGQSTDSATDRTTEESSSTTTAESSTKDSSKESEHTECTEAGFFRHPDDCTKFYRCVDFRGDGQSFVRYDFDCPDGLIFDEINSVCNWPTMTPACESKPSGSTSQPGRETDTSSSTDSTESPVDGTSSKPSTAGSNDKIECKKAGFFRHPDDCNKFYRCVDFKGTEEQFVRYDFVCPEGLVFDESVSVCNWPSDSPACESGSTTDSDQSGSTTDSDQSGSTTDSNQSGSTTDSDQSSSTTDSRTTSGTTDSSTTGKGDETTADGMTQSTTETTPGIREQSSTETSSKSSTTTTPFECTEEGFFRNPDDCSKYYQCIKTNDSDDLEKREFDCPDGHIFDEQGKYCNAIELSEPCETGSTGEGSSSSTTSENTGSTQPTSEGSTTAESSSTTKSTKESFECTEEGFFRHPEDCAKYYQCIKTDDSDVLEKREFDCPEGHIFDEEGKYCNAIELSPPCENGATEDGSSTTESSSGQSTSSSGSTQPSTDENSSGGTSTTVSSECTEEGFFRHPQNCSRYYQCIKSDDSDTFEKREFVCPEDHIFDEEGKYCNAIELSPPCETESTTTSGQSTDTSTDSESNTDTSTTSESRTESTTGSRSSTGSTTGSRSSTGSTTDLSTESSTDSTSDLRSTQSTTSDETTSTDSSRTTDESSEQTSTSASTTSQGKDDPECTKAGFFRDPNDCNKFYRCVDFAGTEESFVRYNFDCPEELVFDEVNSVCTWPTLSPPCKTESVAPESIRLRGKIQRR